MATKTILTAARVDELLTAATRGLPPEVGGELKLAIIFHDQALRRFARVAQAESARLRAVLDQIRNTYRDNRPGKGGGAASDMRRLAARALDIKSPVTEDAPPRSARGGA